VVAVVQQSAEERGVRGRGRRGRDLHVQEVRARLTPNPPHPEHTRGRSPLKSLCVATISLGLEPPFKEKIDQRHPVKRSGSPSEVTELFAEERHLVFADARFDTPKPPGRDNVSTVCGLYNPPNSKNGTLWAQVSKEGAAAV
jgi:hypothetical protein